MTDQLQLVPLPARPQLAVEYARCYLAGETRDEEDCRGCGWLRRVERHGFDGRGRPVWLCKACHLRAHGRR